MSAPYLHSEGQYEVAQVPKLLYTLTPLGLEEAQPSLQVVSVEEHPLRHWIKLAQLELC